MPQKDGEPIVEVKLEVTLNDKLKALELLGKYFSMFVEKKQDVKKDLDVKLKRALGRFEKKKAAKVLKMVPDITWYQERDVEDKLILDSPYKDWKCFSNPT